MYVFIIKPKPICFRITGRVDTGHSERCYCLCPTAATSVLVQASGGQATMCVLCSYLCRRCRRCGTRPSTTPRAPRAPVTLPDSTYSGCTGITLPSLHRSTGPRPRHTVVQSPRPRPTYEHGSSSHQPDPSQSGPSQPILYEQPDPTQPGSSTWHPPPMYGLGMPPSYGYGMLPGYQFAMSQGYGIHPPQHNVWNPSAMPMSQIPVHLRK